MNTELIPTGDSFGPLSPHVNSYLHQVRAQGYAIGSLYEQVCALRLFGHWLKRTGRGLRDIDEGVTRHLLRHVIKRRYPKNAAPATLRRLLGMLRRVGVTPEPEAARSTPCAQVTAAYERFLTEERNLAPETVHRLRRTADRFVSEQFGGGALKLDPSQVRTAAATFARDKAVRRVGITRPGLGR